MQSLAEITSILQQLKPIIKAKYQVHQLGVFGSYVRNEQTEDSDVDVLIDYVTPPSLMQLVDLEMYLSESLGIKVDLVTMNGLKPRYRERIMADLVYI